MERSPRKTAAVATREAVGLVGRHYGDSDGSD